MTDETQNAVRAIAVISMAIPAVALFTALSHNPPAKGFAAVALMSLCINVIIARGLWEWKEWARLWLIVRLAFSGILLMRNLSAYNIGLLIFFGISLYYLCRPEVVPRFKEGR